MCNRLDMQVRKHAVNGHTRILSFCQTWDMRFKEVSHSFAEQDLSLLLATNKNLLQASARFSWQKPAQRHVPSIEQPRYDTLQLVEPSLSHLDSRLDMPLHYSYILPDGGKKQKSNLSCWEPLPRWSQSRTKRQFQLRDQLWHAQLGCLLFCRRGDSLQLQPQAFESGRLCAIVCASDCWDLKVMCKSPRIVKNCCTLIYSIYYPLPLLSPEVDL